jgi:hypothetical protein
VLLDKRGRRIGQLGGRSPYMQAVHVAVPADHAPRGAETMVRVTAALAHSIEGVVAVEAIA